MKFKKVFRGYAPEEVDKLLADNATKEKQIRTSQKERIDELLEENRALREQVKQYHANEKAISKSLIDVENLGQELRLEAEKYSQLVVNKAKIFCASWRAYSQTLVASLSDQEVREFNFLQRKIESMIKSYEAGEGGAQAAAAQASSSNTVDERASETAISGLTNPISRVEGVVEHVIELKELTSTDLSLEEICAELGLHITDSRETK